jgi:hypothetical protein
MRKAVFLGSKDEKTYKFCKKVIALVGYDDYYMWFGCKD